MLEFRVCDDIFQGQMSVVTCYDPLRQFLRYSPTNIKTNNINILINHFSNLVENNFITKFEINKEHINDNKDYSNISFITLTNSGYIDYTLNCLQSLKNINMKKFEILSKKNVAINFIHLRGK